MVVSIEKIQKMLEETGFPMGFGMHREIAFLPILLEPTEIIKSAAICLEPARNETNFIILTDRKMLYIDISRTIGNVYDEYSLEDLLTITFKNGLLLGTIEFNHAGKVRRIKKVDKKTGEIFVERANIAKSDYTHSILTNPFMKYVG
ncbi:MAG: PH domain-containing protein [Streptococcaceae bacterium]|jgi:tRNA U34 2-thiouridine synthase MnmA/TrmU|nr:PH domain-containing protein [Streptococcaceae bacterium]